MSHPPSTDRSAGTLALPRLEDLPASIRTLIARCVVAFRLFAAVTARRALDERERHVLIQTFSHLGEEGRLFIHQMLAQAPDYDPDTVNRKIHAVSPQPVSCSRIRQHLRLDAERDGCNCVFKLDAETYATPLCHLDMFPASGTLRLGRLPSPPDLDGDGRTRGYLSRRVKAASELASDGAAGREQAAPTPLANRSGGRRP